MIGTALLVLGLPLLLGCACLRLLGVAPRVDGLAYPAWAWAAGSLATSGLLYAWLWCAPMPSPLALALAAAALAAGAFALAGRRTRRPPAATRVRIGPRSAWEGAFFCALCCGCVLLVVARIADASTLPVLVGDDAACWTLHAKLLYVGRSLPATFRAAVSDPASSHLDYPLMNSLLQAWGFGLAGKILHFDGRLPILAFALLLIPLLAAALRTRVRPLVAGSFVCVVVATRVDEWHCRNAYSDLMVAYGWLMALDAWLRWRESGERAFLRLAGMGALLMVAAKHEGLLYLACTAIALALERWLARGTRRPPEAYGWLVPAGLLGVHGFAFDAWFGLRNDLLGGIGQGEWSIVSWQALQRAASVLRTMALDVWLSPLESGTMYLLFFAGILLCPATWKQPALRPLTLALCLTIAGHVCVYVGTPYRLEWHLGASLSRVCWQILPALTLWASLYLGRCVPGFAPAPG